MKKSVKIFFKNGTTIEGKIKKHSKKRLVVKIKDGAKLIIYNPLENILMILENKNKSKESKQYITPGIKVELEQIWTRNYDGNEYLVVDMIQDCVTLENVVTKQQITLKINEIVPENGWNFICDRGFVIQGVSNSEIINEPIADEEITIPSYKEDISLHSKKLVELHLLKKQNEIERLTKKVKTFIPNQTSGVHIYDIPNFKKSSVTNSSSAKNS